MDVEEEDVDDPVPTASNKRKKRSGEVKLNADDDLFVPSSSSTSRGRARDGRSSTSRGRGRQQAGSSPPDLMPDAKMKAEKKGGKRKISDVPEGENVGVDQDSKPKRKKSKKSTTPDPKKKKKGITKKQRGKAPTGYMLNPLRAIVNRDTAPDVLELRKGQKFFIGDFSNLPGSQPLPDFGALKATFTTVSHTYTEIKQLEAEWREANGISEEIHLLMLLTPLMPLLIRQHQQETLELLLPLVIMTKMLWDLPLHHRSLLTGMRI